MLAQEPMREPVQQAAQKSVQNAVQLPPAESGANPVKLVHVDFAATTPVLSPEKFVATNEPASPEPTAVAAPSVPTPPSISPPPDNHEIAMLVKRGKDFLVNGDFASARLFLKRAAEAGAPRARWRWARLSIPDDPTARRNRRRAGYAARRAAGTKKRPNSAAPRPPRSNSARGSRSGAPRGRDDRSRGDRAADRAASAMQDFAGPPETPQRTRLMGACVLYCTVHIKRSC